MRHHPPELRAAAMASLLAGQAVTEVARTYSVPSSTVSRWKREALNLAGRSKDVGELMVRYLRGSLESMEKQAALMGSVDYLEKSPMRELALAHGILSDKVIRILEGLGEPAQGEDEAP